MPLTNDDPLGTASSPREDAVPKKKSDKSNNAPIGLAVLVFMPFLMFSMLSILFAFAYHHYYYAVWLVAFVWIILVVIYFVLDSRNRMHGGWFRSLGFLCMFGVLNGCLCGSLNYWSYMFQYWSYNEKRVFTNVLPTEPAESHADAGTIIFADTARIDSTRALGYKSGSTYCVAPIMDVTDVQLDATQINRRTSIVEYWAAGVDCCPARGDFNCDDAWDPKAKSGLVVLGLPGRDSAVSNRKGPVSLWKSERDYYVMAVREAEANYDLTSAAHPIFVHWVSDAQHVEDDYWRSGVGFVVASVCIYFLISVIFGSATQMYSKRQATAQGNQVETPS